MSKWLKIWIYPYNEPFTHFPSSALSKSVNKEGDLKIKPSNTTMDITSKLMLLFGTIGAIILALEIFGVFDLIKKKVPTADKNLDPTSPNSPNTDLKHFKRIRGDEGPKILGHNTPVRRLNNKKVVFVSRAGKNLHAKFKPTKDGRAAIQRGNNIFFRKLAA